MKRETLASCVREAERFITFAGYVLTEDTEQERDTVGDDISMWVSPRLTGAVRRASMDLTRQLADLRQNR